MSRVVSASREVIEGKLLAALDDAEKVAVVFSREDLDDVIDAMESGCLTARTKGMLADFRKLRAAAFGERR